MLDRFLALKKSHCSRSAKSKKINNSWPGAIRKRIIKCCKADVKNKGGRLIGRVKTYQSFFKKSINKSNKYSAEGGYIYSD